MKHFCDDWIREWCDDNGWTDLFIERYNNYWAFPPGAVMPEPIPVDALRVIKITKGLCQEEKTWLMGALVLSIVAIVSSYVFKSPMPIVFAFAFDAVTAAQLEVEEI
ncbi:conserved hypothetical protein [Rippkaea orientalis PCC 8801]|uniref:Uncharacterized protein n=1 Tax=Rippkaea orientalis (strain PCC 8801 / RF-1) TaxID=41431 RepID=B7K2W8_RIPO1|nr:hypothetical protein [Rippkaea orientalis]ACK67669.1 conserved hypothetical protein [Rippkaea orientalis PCC 8801]